MSVKLIAVAVLSTLVGAAAIALAPRLSAAQWPSPDKVRFRLLSEEPIATGDGRNVVTLWGAEIIRDTQTDLCYILIVNQRGSSVLGTTPCPQ